MRMRELEKASGVSRETIRFYIREGLLPEPDRTHRNSATYSDDHLARLLTIRRLRDERFLPLSVIRSLFEGQQTGWLEPQMLPEIDHLLRARLDSEEAWVNAEAFIADIGGEPEHLANTITAGVIAPAPDGGISPRDQRILRLLVDAAKIGFTRERGYADSSMGRLAAVMHSLAEMEVKDFFANVAPHVGELEAADMAERGIGILNQLMAEFFTREVLALLSERRRIANDNRTAQSANHPAKSAPE
ncbi:MerR family transcriptional regulator [Sandaracinobacter sp. RS1-74]|uniref:MerR family transcriptional regulator n=1 Tax=Sandaracinobacteroides sayramensis TaxID=2913411 RepID=UPI001EDAF8D4|nr:MerR family transcriptional regulator [Sandaracinobacteroides sayramensis]MCG2842418.1 MerR family transcriptional regulator [Sandaracinobacteroides sayramensis]